jgi:hypothetical protein
MYRLVFQDREATRPPFTGDATPVTIGRAADCQLQLAAAGIHDRHATLERRPTGYYLRDLTGQRAVRVNGQAIGDQRLGSGDEVELGSVRCRFEVRHDPPPRRWALDVWQLAAGAAVLLLLAGQLGLLGWIFTQPHPREMKTDIVKGGRHARKNQPPSPRPEPAAPVPLLPLTAPAASTLPPAPATLPRALRILKADRADTDNQAGARVQVKAQIGERTLETGAVAVTVEFLDAAGRSLGLVRLNPPATWENFSTKQFTARLAAAPATVRGFVVRTYYRQQLQDQLTVP